MPDISQTLVLVKPGQALAWGNLVKAWAMGTAVPPRTLAELKQQAGDLLSIPDFMTGLLIVHHSREVMTINLPTKSLVEDAAQALMPPSAQYQVPDFYSWLSSSPGGPLVPPDRRQDFQTARIGEYSIANCM